MPTQSQNAGMWIFMDLYVFGLESGKPGSSRSRWQTCGRKGINGITVWRRVCWFTWAAIARKSHTSGHRGQLDKTLCKKEDNMMK